ncbi:rho GTPase-activating protein 20-like isoform X2 [Notamacropus eugenii]|uniref:rho GTPase-activating protein 20-like isoform X2 n=1 Tax=Notamacropus eugenii TaxID=9315 RepID=UPI003B66B97C
MWGSCRSCCCSNRLESTIWIKSIDSLERHPNLKGFLQNIPGTLFSSDLFHEWVCIMDQVNDEDKINRIKSLMEQLPRTKTILLEHVFGMLHKIQQESKFDKMTSYNLAVCIAPSILWPSSSVSPELEMKFIEKVFQLIEFIIENFCRIFGQEVTSPLIEILVNCDRDNASEDAALTQESESTIQEAA